MPVNMEQIEVQKRTAAAWQSVQRGNAQEAIAELEPLIAANDPATPWMIVARACNMAGDKVGEEQALDRQLAHVPRHLLALLRKGEIKRDAGDDRGATAFFQTALNIAAHEADIPAAIQPLLDQARRHNEAAQAKFSQHLENVLEHSGASAAGRVGEAVDLLLGRKQLYQQQPNSFYFPGLPQRQFFEREEFEWLPSLEAAIHDMQAELRTVLAATEVFEPYVASSGDRPRPANPLLDDPRWSARYFWKNGEIVADNAAQCPATMAALKHAPMPVIAQRSPMALWSMLQPGTHIQPHHGLLNTRLICHIPLIAPPDCALRVGNETRNWEEGKTLIFDDSFEHEAWNRSDSTRVVLLFEIWRPEITLAEREALVTIFETINSYQGMAQDTG
jgi:aspartyl/asparaginyl beta-hydroxylase (cupin superfamily)